MLFLLLLLSAGVGRTGVFIALDHLIQHVRDHDFVDVYGLVAELRSERMCMVQNLVSSRQNKTEYFIPMVKFHNPERINKRQKKVSFIVFILGCSGGSLVVLLFTSRPAMIQSP